MEIFCGCINFSILRPAYLKAWETKLVEREQAKWDIFVHRERG